MSDDLVKRLRDTPNWKREEYGDYKSAIVHYDRAPFEAADRIEELEAKLAKAVGALDLIATHRKKCHEYDDDVGHERREFDVEDVIIMENAARAAVAELKGQDDEV